MESSQLVPKMAKAAQGLARKTTCSAQTSSGGGRIRLARSSKVMARRQSAESKGLMRRQQLLTSTASSGLALHQTNPADKISPLIK